LGKKASRRVRSHHGEHCEENLQSRIVYKENSLE